MTLIATHSALYAIYPDVQSLALTHILLGKLKIIGRDMDQGFRI
jgi:hypothetical protein